MKEFDIGSFRIRALHDAESKTTRYIVGSDEYHSEPFDTVAEALANLAGMIQGEGNVLDRPFSGTPRLSASATETIAQATAQDWEQLRCMIPIDARSKGVPGKAVMRAGSTLLGDALFSVLEMPEEARDAVLPEGVRVHGDFDPNGAQPALVTVHVETQGARQTYEYALVRTNAAVLHQGGLVPVTVWMIAGKPQWEQLGISRSPLPEYSIGSYTQMLEGFSKSASESLNAIDDEVFEGRDPEADVSRLLAYCAGVVRWMVHNDYSHDGEKVNPWYALGLTLLTQFGLQDGDQIFQYGRSIFDDLRAIQAAPDVPGTATFVMGKPEGGVN